MNNVTLVIHGGAGTILPDQMTTEKENAYKNALTEALHCGFKVLQSGKSAIDAVEKAVKSMEDSPLFNAGRGSVFTADGTHEMDASIMSGKDADAGAIAMVRGVRNPISLARAVMERSGHVFLAADGAERFARSIGIAFEEPGYFHDDFRYEQWQQIRDTDQTQLDHSVVKDQKFGTVGAVALDQQGNLAAATSTGGMTNKRFGRIGDSSIIGAGNYANNQTCAVSCTGNGEFFIRGVAAYDVATLMEHKSLSLPDACKQVVHERLPKIGGDGGLIAVDTKGNISLEFNTEGMYRGFRRASGEEEVAIYK